MTTFAWPSQIIPAASAWRFLANTAAFVSPLTGGTRTLGRGGDRFAASLTLPPLTDHNAQYMTAWLSQLRGQAHRVALPDHSYRKRGALTTNVLVKGASQTGLSLLVDGAAPSLTNALLSGDIVSVDGHFYILTSTVNSDGAGEITLTLNRPLLSSPADNANVEVLAPTCLMMLADQAGGWANQPGYFKTFSFDFVEDINL